uniref:Uncharacterized protein n=1 Tax=Schistosoma haematobium TaxID=6185 RepID=A0A094ZU33_SCHHA
MVIVSRLIYGSLNLLATSPQKNLLSPPPDTSHLSDCVSSQDATDDSHDDRVERIVNSGNNFRKITEIVRKTEPHS